MKIENKEKNESELPNHEGKIISERDFDIDAATSLLARCHTAYLEKVQEVKYGQKTIEGIKIKLAAGEDLNEDDIAVFQEMAKNYRPNLAIDPNRNDKKLFESLGIEIRENSLN
jgi:hypothetical protein